MNAYSVINPHLNDKRNNVFDFKILVKNWLAFLLLLFSCYSTFNQSAVKRQAVTQYKNNLNGSKANRNNLTSFTENSLTT